MVLRSRRVQRAEMSTHGPHRYRPCFTVWGADVQPAAVERALRVAEEQLCPVVVHAEDRDEHHGILRDPQGLIRNRPDCPSLSAECPPDASWKGKEDKDGWREAIGLASSTPLPGIARGSGALRVDNRLDLVRVNQG